MDFIYKFMIITLSVVGLTLAALEKHNEKVEDELDIGDLAISEKTGTSIQSKAFSISGLTDCSNMTFSKVMDHWNSGNIIDQEVSKLYNNYLNFT